MNSKRIFFQSGEIATTAMLLGIGIMAVGAVFVSRLSNNQQAGTQDIRSSAQVTPVDPTFSSACASCTSASSMAVSMQVDNIDAARWANDGKQLFANFFITFWGTEFTAAQKQQAYNILGTPTYEDQTTDWNAKNFVYFIKNVYMEGDQSTQQTLSYTWTADTPMDSGNKLTLRQAAEQLGHMNLHFGANLRKRDRIIVCVGGTCNGYAPLLMDYVPPGAHYQFNQLLTILGTPAAPEVIVNVSNPNPAYRIKVIASEQSTTNQVICLDSPASAAQLTGQCLGLDPTKYYYINAQVYEPSGNGLFSTTPWGHGPGGNNNASYTFSVGTCITSGSFCGPNVAGTCCGGTVCTQGSFQGQPVNLYTCVAPPTPTNTPVPAGSTPVANNDTFTIQRNALVHIPGAYPASQTDSFNPFANDTIDCTQLMIPCADPAQPGVPQDNEVAIDTTQLIAHGTIHQTFCGFTICYEFTDANATSVTYTYTIQYKNGTSSTATVTLNISGTAPTPTPVAQNDIWNIVLNENLIIRYYDPQAPAPAPCSPVPAGYRVLSVHDNDTIQNDQVDRVETQWQNLGVNGEGVVSHSLCTPEIGYKHTGTSTSQSFTYTIFYKNGTQSTATVTLNVTSTAPCNAVTKAPDSVAVIQADGGTIDLSSGTGSIPTGDYKISWDSAVPNATNYAIRIDKNADSWFNTTLGRNPNDCTEINQEDTCQDDVQPQLPYAFESGITYHIWVHAYNSCTTNNGGWDFAKHTVVTVTENPPASTNTPTPTPTTDPGTSCTGVMHCTDGFSAYRASCGPTITPCSQDLKDPSGNLYECKAFKEQVFSDVAPQTLPPEICSSAVAQAPPIGSATSMSAVGQARGLIECSRVPSGTCTSEQACAGSGDVIVNAASCPADPTATTPNICCVPFPVAESLSSATICKNKKDQGFYRDPSNNTCYKCNEGRFQANPNVTFSYGVPVDTSLCDPVQECLDVLGLKQVNGKCYQCYGNKLGESYGQTLRACPTDMQFFNQGGAGNQRFSLLIQLNNLGQLTKKTFVNLFTFFTRTPGQLLDHWTF